MADNQKSRNEPSQNNAMVGSLLGNVYQIRVTLIAVIKAGILMKQDNSFKCNISAEELEAGKFDDVSFHNTFRGMFRKLYVQAKNRMNGQKISWKELVESQSKGAFSIIKYFTSFMTTKQHNTEGEQYLALCSNVDLDDEAKTSFEPFVLPEACDIFSCLGATCYRFTEDSLKKSNKYDTIVRLLKECSDNYKLSTLLAEIIYDGKELDLTANNPQRPDTALLYKYSVPLGSLIGKKRGKTAIHDLKEKFITGSELSPNEQQFREAFETAYKLKLMNQDKSVWEDVKAKGIKVKSKAKKQDETAAKSQCSQFPEDAITNEDIEMFFQQFVFVANANELATKIKNILIKSDIVQLQQAQVGPFEIDAMFNYLYNLILNWIMGKSDLPTQLEAGNVRDILTKTYTHLQYLKLKNLSMEYVNALKVDKRCIKKEPLKNLPLHDFLKPNSSEEDRLPTIFTFYSPYETKLSLRILHETFKLCYDGTDRSEVLFLDSKKYNEHKETLQEILFMVKFRFVLIIECKDTSLADQLKQEMFTAFQSLEPRFQKVEKKIILVAQVQENDPCPHGAENTLVLEHFVQGSIQHVLSDYDSVTMFGTDIPLSALMRDHDDVKILYELTEEPNRAMLRHSLTEEHYKRIETCYVQRSFEILNIPVDNAALNDLRCLSDDKEGFLKTFKLIPPMFQDYVSWKMLKMYLHNYSHVNAREFLYGELTIGLPEYQPPGLGESDTTKVHMFLDEAGYGKTTYLSWMGGYLQNIHRSFWIIRLNSIDHSTDFKRLLEGDQRQDLDDTLALRILYRMVHLGLFVRNINYQTIKKIDRERKVAEQCASLMTISNGIVIVDEERWKRMKWTPLQLVTVRFFAEQFNNRKLVILFDGFDELVPHYKKVAYDLLSKFESFEGIAKMYITSRPYNLTDEFREVFKNVTFYKLKIFSDENILTMIHLFMQSEFEPYRGSKNVDCFLEGLWILIKYYMGTLSRVPLFVRLILDVLRPFIAANVDFTACTITRAFFDMLETDFEWLSLIEKFVENKIAKANGEKIQLTDSASNIPCARSSLEKLRKLTLNTHGILALYVLFDRTELEGLQIDEQAKECMDEVNDGNEKLGIIEAIVGDRPIFIHRTFAEYFAALWLYTNKKKTTVLSFLKSFAFWEDNRAEIRDFFDRMAIKESGWSPIHVAILERASLLVMNMIEKNPDVWRTLDAGKRSIAHLLVLHDSTNRLRNVNCNPYFINQRDAILNWSPLDYAFIIRNEYACVDLLNKGATIDANHLIDIILSHDLSTILRKTLQYGEFINELKIQCCPITLGHLIAKLRESVAHYLFSKKIDLHAPVLNEVGSKLSPLEYFVSHNDWLMMKVLANRAGYPPTKLLTPHQDRYVLLAFESGALDVIQFLMFELLCTVPAIVNNPLLRNINKKCVIASLDRLSTVLFKIYSRRNVEYVDHLYESFCYVYNFLDREEMFNPPGIDAGMLAFLRTSFKHLKIDDAKRCLQRAQLDLNSFTYPFIVECMKKCNLKNNRVHWVCEEALLHLVDKTTDLHAVDQDGKTLLDIAQENNCSRVAQYLVDENSFSSLQCDVTNDWNPFSYCLMEPLPTKFLVLIP